MRVSEDQIRKITIDVINELGDKATPDKVKQMVSESVRNLSDEDYKPSKSDASVGRVIITSFGLNEPGVVAAITTRLSEAKCDILDLSQKIMHDFFTIIMIVDITNSPKDFRELQDTLKIVADELGIKIYLQHEEVFRQMHRL